MLSNLAGLTTEFLFMILLYLRGKVTAMVLSMAMLRLVRGTRARIRIKVNPLMSHAHWYAFCTKVSVIKVKFTVNTLMSYAQCDHWYALYTKVSVQVTQNLGRLRNTCV